MNIIIEGMDRSGKSTVIQKIQEIYPTLKYVHFTTTKLPNQPENDVVVQTGVSIYDQIKKYVTDHEELLATPDKGIIFDRFTYTDASLGMIYKNSGEVCTTPAQQKELDEYMAKFNTCVIFCRLQNKCYHKWVLEEEGTNEVLLENYDTIYNNYWETLTRAAMYLPVFTYDWQDEYAMEQLRMFLKYNKKLDK